MMPDDTPDVVDADVSNTGDAGNQNGKNGNTAKSGTGSGTATTVQSTGDAGAVATPPADDPAPRQELADIAEDVARADAIKPVAAALGDLFPDDPATGKAKAVVDAYTKAMGTAQVPGDLRTAYAVADQKFVRAARDMEAQLADWATRCLGTGGTLAALVAERDQVGTRLKARSGARELARADAQAASKNWADRYADWLGMPAKAKAQIGDYVDKIDKLNADINNQVKADLAIFSFWFEVAPKHLQLRNTPTSEANTPGFDVLKSYAVLAAKLKSGPERADGSLYLIEPDRLGQHLIDLVNIDWRQAAGAQAKAEAAFKLRPDDAASLKARFDKIKDDGWFARAKAVLDPPA